MNTKYCSRYRKGTKRLIKCINYREVKRLISCINIGAMKRLMTIVNGDVNLVFDKKGGAL